jgi:hypothetical protein
MAVNITDANTYIASNCIETEDWNDSLLEKKQRLLNVSGRTLTMKYPGYIIPDNAVYEFANTLATQFNDTLKMQHQGVASFAVTGVASFTFKDWTEKEIDDLIPKICRQLIGQANSVDLTSRVKWTVL